MRQIIRYLGIFCKPFIEKSPKNAQKLLINLQRKLKNGFYCHKIFYCYHSQLFDYQKFIPPITIKQQIEAKKLL